MSAAAMRIGRWFGAARPLDHDDIPKPSVHDQRRQQELDDIGAFLLAHDLEISDSSFAVVRAHLGGDGYVRRQVDAVLRECGKLTDGDVARIAKGRAAGLEPERLASIADRVNDKLQKCVKIIGQSSECARDYGAAISSEAAGYEADPLGTIERLLALTRTVTDRTLDLENQLEREQKETQRLRSHLTQARREADHDHLTGLPNRRSFEFRLAALPIDPPATTRVCVAICDIDRFKRINDEHGHDTGDRVLRYFAKRLSAALAGHAVVARYGGEEFACLFEDSSVADAARMLDTIREAFDAKPLVSRTSGKSMPPLTFSAGIARIDGDPGRALTGADRALYEAKRKGRNRVEAVAAGPST